MDATIKYATVAALGLLALVASLLVWQRSRVLTVYFPNGAKATFAESQLPSIAWESFVPGVAESADEKMMPRHRKLIRHVDYHLRETSGTLQFSCPNPPRRVDLIGNMRHFPDYTGKSYLVAKELLNSAKSNWISFTFGSVSNPRSGREYVQANLDCIRTNGVITQSLQSPNFPLSTTACAVVVGPRSVWIAPARYFQEQPTEPDRLCVD